MNIGGGISENVEKRSSRGPWYKGNNEFINGQKCIVLYIF